jgi:hypothetical protein
MRFHPSGAMQTYFDVLKILLLLKLRDRALAGAREVLLQGSFYEVSLALVGVASLAYFQY